MDKQPKKRSSGQRPKKKKFQGNSYCKKITIGKTSCFVKSEPKRSSSSKKLTSSYSVLKSQKSNASKEFKGYRIIDISMMFSVLASFICCKVCQGTISIKEKFKCGLYSTFEVQCKKCKEVLNIQSCRKFGKKKNLPEINRRSVLAMRFLGQSLTGLSTFCSIMALPAPVTQKAYDKINEKILSSVKEVAVSSMKEAASEEKALNDQSENITVSGDGTWKTRGHSSLIGACTLIGAESGKVIDVEVMSSYCKKCDSYKGKKFGPEYLKWYSMHKSSCKKNHSGSAGKMEVDGMMRIFSRSVEERGVKYQQYIGDGDSKTFSAISELSPYGKEYDIQKVECVGHIQKRMGTRLRKLKLSYGKKKLSDGKSIGGKGRLTDSLINQLTVYYGNAIRANSSSVIAMRTAIWAVWAHTASTDKEPMHWFCPKGPNSWCKYNNAAFSKVSESYKHKKEVSKAVMLEIKPIFKDLSHPQLLKRCLGSRTQNSNESLNSLIWKYCPKVIGSGRNVAEIAAYLAASIFNNGFSITIDILKSLNLTIQEESIKLFTKCDEMRIETAEKRKTNASFEARRAKKAKKVVENEKLIQKEGESYVPGGF